MASDGPFLPSQALLFEHESHGGDLKECIGQRIKPACLYIHNHRQKPAKALRYPRLLFIIYDPSVSSFH
jgi:hypothetical protein